MGSENLEWEFHLREKTKKYFVLLHVTCPFNKRFNNGIGSVAGSYCKDNNSIKYICNFCGASVPKTIIFQAKIMGNVYYI